MDDLIVAFAELRLRPHVGFSLTREPGPGLWRCRVWSPPGDFRYQSEGHTPAAAITAALRLFDIAEGKADAV